MEILPIQLAVLAPPKDDLREKIAQARFVLGEYDVVALSSKVVAIDEGRCVKKSEVANREALAKQEADAYLERRHTPGGHTVITRKGSAFVGFAGVDPLGDYYVLWPEDPMQSADRLCAWFKARYGIANLALIITDSHSAPLRRGALGFAVAWAGFAPLVDSQKRKDFFGVPSGGSAINLPDAFAAAANLAMGEGNEQTPMVIIKDAPYMRDPRAPRREPEVAFEVPHEKDMYAPLFACAPWKRGGNTVTG